MYEIKDEKNSLPISGLWYAASAVFIPSDSQNESEVTISEPLGKTRGGLVVAMCSDDSYDF